MHTIPALLTVLKVTSQLIDIRQFIF